MVFLHEKILFVNAAFSFVLCSSNGIKILSREKERERERKRKKEEVCPLVFNILIWSPPSFSFPLINCYTSVGEKEIKIEDVEKTENKIGAVNEQ